MDFLKYTIAVFFFSLATVYSSAIELKDGADQDILLEHKYGIRTISKRAMDWSNRQSNPIVSSVEYKLEAQESDNVDVTTKLPRIVRKIRFQNVPQQARHFEKHGNNVEKYGNDTITSDKQGRVVRIRKFRKKMTTLVPKVTTESSTTTSTTKPLVLRPNAPQQYINTNLPTTTANPILFRSVTPQMIQYAHITVINKEIIDQKPNRKQRNKKPTGLLASFDTLDERKPYKSESDLRAQSLERQYNSVPNKNRGYRFSNPSKNRDSDLLEPDDLIVKSTNHEEITSNVNTRKQDEKILPRIPISQERGQDEKVSPRIPTLKERRQDEKVSPRIPTSQERREDEKVSPGKPTSQERRQDEKVSSRIPTSQEKRRQDEKASHRIPTSQERRQDEKVSSRIPTSQDRMESSKNQKIKPKITNSVRDVKRLKSQQTGIASQPTETTSASTVPKSAEILSDVPVIQNKSTFQNISNSKIDVNYNDERDTTTQVPSNTDEVSGPMYPGIDLQPAKMISNIGFRQFPLQEYQGYPYGPANPFFRSPGGQPPLQLPQQQNVNPLSPMSYRQPQFYPQNREPQFPRYYAGPQRYSPYQRSGSLETPGFYHSPQLESLRRSIMDAYIEEESIESTTDYSLPKFDIPSIDFNDKGCRTVYKEVSAVPAGGSNRRNGENQEKSFVMTRECFFPEGVPTTSSVESKESIGDNTRKINLK